MLNLKLWYLGHLMATDLEKTLILGKIECRRRKRPQRMRWFGGVTDSMDMSWWWTGKPGLLQSLGLQRVDITERLNWTECSTLRASFFRIWNSSVVILWRPLPLFIVMLPKAHLTSHSRISGYSWVITHSWLSGSLRPSLYSSVYSCYLFLVSSASFRPIFFLVVKLQEAFS